MDRLANTVRVVSQMLQSGKIPSDDIPGLIKSIYSITPENSPTVAVPETVAEVRAIVEAPVSRSGMSFAEALMQSRRHLSHSERVEMAAAGTLAAREAALANHSADQSA